MPYGANARLPEKLEARQILSMAVGEEGWTVPWAMFAETDGTLWLNGAYTIDAAHFGTAQMRILRSPEGYHVDIQRCRDHRWSRGMAVYVGGNNAVPVVKLLV